MSDNKFLQYGVFNLGFVALRKTPEVLNIVDWWGRQLIDKCVINLSQGLFVDQKWADLFPAFINRVTVLHHQGYNIAYWNLSQRKIELVNDRWYSNQLPVRFVHFSGNNLNDPYFLSRHSGVHTRDTMGDFNYLLKSYRQRIFENGHAEYSKIPYSFSRARRSCGARKGQTANGPSLRRCSVPSRGKPLWITKAMSTSRITSTKTA